LHAGAGEIQDHEHGGDDALDDQCRVGRGEAWMNVAEPGWHVGIESGNERDAGAATHPGRTDAGNGEAEHYGERNGDPVRPDARCHSADCLDYALQHVDALADGDQQSNGNGYVERAGDQASPYYGSRKRARRILNLIAHDRGEFKAEQTEADDSEGIENEERVGGDLKVGGGDGGAEAQVDHHAKADQDGCGNESTNGAEVVDPFADAEAENVEQGEQSEQCESDGRGEDFVVRQSLMAGTERVNGNADEVKHDGRHVEHVVGPVT